MLDKNSGSSRSYSQENQAVRQIDIRHSVTKRATNEAEILPKDLPAKSLAERNLIDQDTWK